VLVVIVVLHVIVMFPTVVRAIPPLFLELCAAFTRCFAVVPMALDSILKPRFCIVNALFATHSTVVIRACW
jgi:hypothetical protein